MFSQQHMPFVAAAAQIDAEAEIKNRIIASGVALALAACLFVPSSADAAPGTFFKAEHCIPAGNSISEFNEVCPFDVQLCMDLVERFWKMRYQTLHCMGEFPLEQGELLCGLTGARRVFEAEELTFMNEHAVAISAIQRAVCKSKG